MVLTPLSTVQHLLAVKTCVDWALDAADKEEPIRIALLLDTAAEETAMECSAGENQTCPAKISISSKDVSYVITSLLAHYKEEKPSQALLLVSKVILRHRLITIELADSVHFSPQLLDGLVVGRALEEVVEEMNASTSADGLLVSLANTEAIVQTQHALATLVR